MTWETMAEKCNDFINNNTHSFGQYTITDTAHHNKEYQGISSNLGGLELLTRYSMTSGRTTSILSSLNEFRAQEAEVAGNREWNWRYLRDQFQQKSLEILYRKYDEKLRDGYITIYLISVLCFSLIHISVLTAYTYKEMAHWHQTYLVIITYTVRLLVNFMAFYGRTYKKLRNKFFWFPVLASLIVVFVTIAMDLSVVMYAYTEGNRLRPVSYAVIILSVYIFLPIRNNYLAIIFGIAISGAYLTILGVFTYEFYPEAFVKLISDGLFLTGVNLLGVYFRLMNEIVKRRSFLDHRACVETTLKLKFERDQEERLMVSILPAHIATRVRQDIRTIFLGLQSTRASSFRKTTNQHYIEEHEDVSILYADIVNYTMISTTLPASRMVELLNELFGRFDEASEEHEVLRIKFLGDCYYCASGIPYPNPQHAKSCVDLGLDMISIIKDVREKRSLNIDMRIGVHSGKVLSGLIGIRKWQYDIWSKDVTIANKMETTGKPGKVHITKQTLESLGESAREYIIEPNFEAQNNEFIRKHRLETYLISKPSRTFMEMKSYRRISVGLNYSIKSTGSSRRRKSNSGTPTAGKRRTTAFMDNNLSAYQQMLRAADTQMAKEIENMDSTYFQKDKDFNIITMMFKSRSLEWKYFFLSDPLFKYYLTICIIVVAIIFSINGITTQGFSELDWYFWLLYVTVGLILIILQPLAWFQFLWIKYKSIGEPKSKFMRFMYDTSEQVVRSSKIRSFVYVILSFSIAGCAIVNLADCTLLRDERSDSLCLSPWHVTQTWILATLLNFLFSRALFLFKWVMAIMMMVFYSWIIWKAKTDLFYQDVSWDVGLDPRISHSMAIAAITVILYLIDRQTEYRNRLDFLWQEQLTKEKEEACTMLKVNNMLLLNILPAHVADVYLNFNRSPDELYYEKYDSVAVMFASLTGYKLGIYNNKEISDKLLVGILDQIISEFDALLMTFANATYKIEKIKLAGWTYMAAVGLDPGRRDSLETSFSSNSYNNEINNPYDKAIVMTIVQFAITMMRKLKNFEQSNVQSFDSLNLRIGISHGAVAAGVLGCLKPLYDIWGHAVNMASRMDSTGESGRIQVTENTALILDECGIKTQYRGKTFVKGAGYIRTYFIPLDEEYNLIVNDRCLIRRKLSKSLKNNIKKKQKQPQVSAKNLLITKDDENRRSFSVRRNTESSDEENNANENDDNLSTRC